MINITESNYMKSINNYTLFIEQDITLSDNEDMNKWPHTLRSLMKLTGESQKSLAESINLSQGLIAQYLNNSRTPKPQTLKKIAKHYNVSIKDLIGEAAFKNIIIEPETSNIDQSGENMIELSSFKTFISLANELNVFSKVPVLDWNKVNEWEKELELIANGNNKKIKYVPAPKNCKKNGYGLWIKDDSMFSSVAGSKSFSEGEYIVIKGDKKPLENDFVLAETSYYPEAVFRQYVMVSGIAYLKPLNTSGLYENIKVTSDVKILGTLVFKGTFY